METAQTITLVVLLVHQVLAHVRVSKLRKEVEQLAKQPAEILSVTVDPHDAAARAVDRHEQNHHTKR